MSVELTHANKLMLARRRAGLTQAHAAERFKVTPARYSTWEKGEEPVPMYVQNTGVMKLGRLQPHERCLMYRLKSGKTQQECAEKLGVSRYWFYSMEMGKVNCDQLLWFWES